MNKLLSSITYVAENSDHVSIDIPSIEKYVKNFRLTETDHWMKACPFDYVPLKNVDDELDRWFLADAMAFCFWGYPKKWTIRYQGRDIDGWWALLACLQRGLENGMPLMDGSYLADISFADAQDLFTGTPGIPLFEERVEAFHNIGRTLSERYDGRFHNYMKSAPEHAVQRVVDIATVFPIFDDVSIYKGERVFFYKKAQLLVHDMAVGFADTPYGHVKGIEKLTGEADYKIPALLRKLGILVYDSMLSEKVDNRVELPADSSDEIEIRANMLYACDLICNRLRERKIKVSPSTLDGILWVQSQKKHPSDKPYHLTSTTDY